MARGDSVTGTFYWSYRAKPGAKLKYSRNFKTKEQAKAWERDALSKNKFYSGNLYYVRSSIDHEYIE